MHESSGIRAVLERSGWGRRRMPPTYLGERGGRPGCYSKQQRDGKKCSGGRRHLAPSWPCPSSRAGRGVARGGPDGAEMNDCIRLFPSRNVRWTRKRRGSDEPACFRVGARATSRHAGRFNVAPKPAAAAACARRGQTRRRKLASQPKALPMGRVRTGGGPSRNHPRARGHP